MAYPERIVPDETSPGPLAIHEKRYRFALPHCAGKRVLDAACGVGYGSAILAEQAETVLGLDVDEDAIAYARTRYPASNLEFRVADLLHPGLDDASFDVVVSFETLEHLTDRDAFLGHVARALRTGGLFVVSTPRAEQTTDAPANPYHHVEYSRADLEALLRRYFGAVELYGQRRVQTRRHRALQQLDVLGLRKRLAPLRSLGRIVTGTAPMQDVTPDGIVIDAAAIDDADEIVAVCGDPRT
jgi:SAM-dependent methyltransferase